MNNEATKTQSGAPIGPILLAVGVGTFMSALDGSIVNTILPVVRTFFAESIATIEWVVTIYLLVVSGLLLTYGRLGDLWGHKLIYSTGFVFFVVGSVLSALSWAVWALILFRGVQAIGAAMLFANSPAIITKNVSPARRGRALGLVATMTYLGLSVGPPLGGLLTQLFGWQSVFYINVPIGLAALLLTWRFVPADRPEQSDESFDVLGAGLFLVGLVLLLFALDQGEPLGWSSAPILGAFAAAIVLLGLFLRTETRVRHPMLDLSLFSEPVFSATTASALLNYIAVYMIVFLMPFYLIQGRHFSPAAAGLILTVQAVTMALAAPISGTLSDRIGSRIPATVGMVLLATGMGLLSRLGPASPTLFVAAGLFVAGLGTGIFISPNNSALMGAAPRGRQGIAAGVLAEARNVGMVLGVGIGGAIFSTLQDRSLYLGISSAFEVAAVVALAGAVASGWKRS